MNRDTSNSLQNYLTLTNEQTKHARSERSSLGMVSNDIFPNVSSNSSHKWSQLVRVWPGNATWFVIWFFLSLADSSLYLFIIWQWGDGGAMSAFNVEHTRFVLFTSFVERNKNQNTVQLDFFSHKYFFSPINNYYSKLLKYRNKEKCPFSIITIITTQVLSYNILPH